MTLRLVGICFACVVLSSRAAAVEIAEVGFSPKGGAEALVLKTINAAHSSIRLAAYAFTAAPIVNALVDAKHRGVDVAVVVDFKDNLEQDRSGKGRAALNILVNAGITALTTAAYRSVKHSQRTLNRIAQSLNTRPRKTMQFRTPQEVFYEKCHLPPPPKHPALHL